MTDTATFSAIDLSRLPVPAIIEPLSYEAIYAEMLARLKSVLPDFDDSLESDPAVRILQVSAYLRLLDRQRVNDAARAVMIAYAQGADLDNLGILLGVERLVLVPADPDTGALAIMEGDEDFRRRIVLAPEAYSVAGPSGAYISRALSADGDVLDASALSPSPARVDVYVLSRTGMGTASPTLIGKVAEALSAETVRPIGDRVSVHAASIQPYAVIASLRTYSGPDPSVALAEARSRVAAFVADQHRIGRDVTRSGLFAALHVPGVQNVLLAAPATDVIVNDTQAAWCTGISISHAGVGEGSGGGPVLPQSLAMAQLPDANRVYQRATLTGGGQGKGQGAIPVGVSVATDTPVYARIRDAGDGTTILQGPWQVTANLTAGSDIVTITGIDARKAWFYVDLSEDGANWPTELRGTTPVAMGGVVFLSGQSLAVRYISKDPSDSESWTGINLTADPFGAVFATYIGTTRQLLTPRWAIPAEGTVYDGAGATELLALLIAASNMSWALAGHAHGATGIQSFTTGTDKPYIDTILNGIDGFEVMIWRHGHSNTSTIISNPALYPDNLTTLFANCAALNTARGTGFKKLLAPIPSVGNTSFGTEVQIVALRQAMKNWGDANGASTIVALDLKLADGIHPTQSGAIVEARHDYRALRPHIGLSGSDQGPSIIGASRSGAVITLSTSATSLVPVGDPAKKFKVFTAGTIFGAGGHTLELALAASDAVIVSGSSITITLANDPGAAAELDVTWGYPLDVQPEQHHIYDQAINPDDGIAVGRGLEYSWLPVRVAGAASGTPANTIAPAISGQARVGQTLAVSNGSWTNAPAGYAYQWRYGDTGTPIVGATGASYAVVAGDVGHSLACTVTATNGSGSTSASSGTTAPVTNAGQLGPNLAMNAATPAFVTGQFGQALDSSANGNYGYTGSNTDNIPNSATWTVEAWIRLASLPTGGNRVAFGQGFKMWIGATTDGKLIGNVLVGTNQPFFFGGVDSADDIAPSGWPVMAIGDWHHVAMSNAPGDLRLYFDGQLLANDTTRSAISAFGSNAFGVGTYSAAAAYKWPGAVEEVAIWSSQRYTGASFTPPAAPYTGSETGLKCLWHLDGNGNAAIG